MTGPKKLCYVNCGLPADERSCYRDIMSRAGDPAALAALPEVQAMIAAAYEVAERNLRAYCVSQVFKETLTEQLCSAIGTPAKAAAQADYEDRILAAIQPAPDARQADLAKAFCMGRDTCGNAMDDVADNWSCGHMPPHCDCARDIEQWRLAADECRALNPPADLVAQIGGE